jgi:hypothetical protein
MAQILRHLGVLVVSLGLLLGVVRPAHAALILTMEEVGADVVVSASGTANLAAFAVPLNIFEPGAMNPSFGFIVSGDSADKTLDAYGPITGPASFGAGAFLPASSGSGPGFGVAAQGSLLVVPDGYASGALLSGTSVYAGTTFASLGVTPGTYVWNWGSGPTADSLTLQIGPAAAPEPVSLSLLAVGVAGFAVRRWRRRTA